MIEAQMNQLYEEITDTKVSDETKLTIYRGLLSEAYLNQNEREIEIYEELIQRLEEKLTIKKR